MIAGIAASDGTWRKAGHTMQPKLARSARVAILLWALAAIALFLGFTLAPVTVPRWFGTAPVVRARSTIVFIIS